MPALDNPVMERFAQAVAYGMRVGAAYAVDHPEATKKTCSENGSKLAKSTNVAPRIAEIKGIATKIETKATAKAIESAAKKLSEALLTMSERRQLLAKRARRPKISESALCSVLRLDAQLAGELIDKTDLTTDGEALPTALPSISLQMPPSFLERRNGHN